MQGMTTDKTRESRLHRMARGQGLRLVKSPRRNPGDHDYGLYMLYDLSTQAALQSGRGTSFCFDLEAVEEYLTGGVRRAW